MVHERHELAGHRHEGLHHVAILVLEDGAVLHERAREILEPHDDVDDLVRVHADGVLEAELVVIEGVVDPSVWR